jgi:hypothetical protein
VAKQTADGPTPEEIAAVVAVANQIVQAIMTPIIAAILVNQGRDNAAELAKAIVAECQS